MEAEESEEAKELGELWCVTDEHAGMAVTVATELLERVFLRLGVAESDSQLEQALARFLTPVLLKTGSPSPAVRSKVTDSLLSWYDVLPVLTMSY